MFENIVKFFKNVGKKESKKQTQENSKDAAKERLHLVLMQDRANVSADFLELMKQEIIDVIKKYIEIDEKEIDVRLTNQENDDGTNGAPALYANIPILNIKNETRKISKKEKEENDDKANHQVKEKAEEKAEVKNEEKEEINQDKTKKENKKEINDNNKEEKQEAEKNNKKENKETANTENKKNNKKEDSKEVTEKEIKSE